MRRKRPESSSEVVGRRRASGSKDAHLLVRLDRPTKRILQRAAGVRGLTVSDYVRSRITSLARQDVLEAETGILRLPRDAQIAFWEALQNPPPLTRAQRALGRRVRSML